MAPLNPKLRNALIVPLGAIVLVLVFDTFMFGMSWKDDTLGVYLNQFPIVWKPLAVTMLDNRMFDEACEEDTPEAYRLYLRSSPNKGHQEEALTLEDESLFAWANSQGTVTAFDRYVRELPEGRYVEEGPGHNVGCFRIHPENRSAVVAAYLRGCQRHGNFRHRKEQSE